MAKTTDTKNTKAAATKAATPTAKAGAKAGARAANSFTVGLPVVVRGQGAGLLREHKREPKDEYVVELEQGTVRIPTNEADNFLRLPIDRKSAEALLHRMCDPKEVPRTLPVLTSSRMFLKLEPKDQAEYVRLLLRAGGQLSTAERQIVTGAEHVLLSEIAVTYGVGMGAVRDAVHRGEPSVTARAGEGVRTSRRS